MNPSHFLLFSIPSWGHVRPLCVLATRLVRERENIIVTFIVAPHVLDKARTEISRQSVGETSEDSKALQRIRILSPYQSNDVDLGDSLKILSDAYPSAYQTLYEAKPITCSVTSTTFDALPAPCAVILNFLAFPVLRATRSISGHSVPIIACVAAGAAALIRLFGPESMGSVGNVSARIDAEAARTGLSVDEIGNKMVTHTEGKLVQLPGLPAMYDYEFYPQKPVPGKPVHKIWSAGYNSFRESDATIVTTSYAYESVSLDAMKQWFSDMQKEIHVLGPLLPAGYGIETQNGEEGAGVETETFLGEMLVQYGKRSVFFISFGTIYWTSVPEHIDELIDALIEKQAPFIMSCASPRAKLSEHQTEKIKSSGLGMLTTWAPQQFILNHPATGWFVTHGGFNSVSESLGSGIPLICWPFTADQPTAAAHLTENLNVAFELFQVRTEDGLKPLYRNGLTPKGTREAVGNEIRQVIDVCRSEKGQELRSNAEELRVKFAKAWDQDGAARHEIRHFIRKYTGA